MIPQVDALAELSKKLHHLTDKDLIDSLAVDIQLTGLPHIRHSAADLLSMKTNTSLSELYVHTQALRVHVDWWITASEDVSLSSRAAEGASAHLLQLDNLVSKSLKWLNEDVPPPPSPSLPVVSTAFDLLRFSVEISERLKAATKLLDELCHLTAQSLTTMDTPEHFKVLKLLGEGSYGKVMLAVHRTSGTPMALKFFPRESTSLFSFLREYNLSLSFCTHPSLTRALGIAYSTPLHYVFTQQAGLFGDLYNVIIPEVGVEDDCCQRVVSQLCGALSHLHSLGFVHRDVKPENVFLCDSACRWVKLGDFGMVARGNKDSWASVNDGNDDVKEDKKDNTKARVWVSVEPSTDSWALGILTYAMLTGSHPWAETASECRSYRIYREWFDRARSRDDERDVWAVPRHKSTDCAITLNEANLGRDNRPPAAPQFASFTTLACSFFQSFLDPRPQLRGRPGDALRYLGGDWIMEKERIQLEEKRKKSRGKSAIKNMKETEGRGER
ncbi:unnamed protein product [Lampetra planeri]